MCKDCLFFSVYITFYYALNVGDVIESTTIMDKGR